MSNEISVKIVRGVQVVTFANPADRNPLSRKVLAVIHEIMDECRDPIVFVGMNDVFASGANLREIATLTAEAAPDFALYGQSLMSKIEDLPYMTIAAINGYCYGGALDLALACKRRIASPHATFAHPCAGLGIITGWGGTQRLPRLVGRANALEMFFTAEPVTAGRALQIGLVDDVCVNPLKDALK
jgi:enoyl-CoA hydratase